MNLHAAGADLLNTVRPSVAGHEIRYQRGDIISAPFMAGSPPRARQFLPSSGLELGEDSRQFIINVCDTELFGTPQRGDTIIDQCDNSEWTVRPAEGLQECWRWHGQVAFKAYFVHTRRKK